MASILVGLVSWIVLALVQSEYPADLLATVLAAVAMIAVGLATAGKEAAMPLLDFDGEPVAYENRLGVLSPLGR